MSKPSRGRPTVIVNPAAGGGRCRKRLPAFRAAAEQRVPGAMEADWRFTEAAGHAREIARDAYLAGTRTFWAIGGDGTAFEVVNGLFDASAEPDAWLALVPLGTGNSFLRQFGIATGENALSALVHGGTAAVDVVRLEHADGVLHSINLICLGFAARVGDLTNRRFKPLGALGYVAAVVTCLARPNHPVLPYAIDGGPMHTAPCTMLAFCNSSYTGGAMLIAPKARIDDGCLDTIHLDAVGRLRLLAAFPSLFRGTHIKRSFVRCNTAREIAFELKEPTQVLIDGEIYTLKPKRLTLLPKRIKLITGNFSSIAT